MPYDAETEALIASFYPLYHRNVILTGPAGRITQQSPHGYTVGVAPNPARPCYEVDLGDGRRATWPAAQLRDADRYYASFLGDD